MSDLNTSLSRLGVTPEVQRYVDLVRIVVDLGSGVYNVVAATTGDRGVLLAARWMDFLLGVQPTPPGLSDEDYQKLADICADTEWMNDTGGAIATQITSNLTPLLSAIPGAGVAAKTAADIVLAVWGFARLFRNKICSSPEIRAIISRRPDLSARLVDATPASLRTDHASALRRRLAVEAALEAGQRNPPSSEEGRRALEAARADDVPSSENLIAKERLILRFGPLPSLQGAPPSTVARRYIRRPPGFTPPVLTFNPTSFRARGFRTSTDPSGSTTLRLSSGGGGGSGSGALLFGAGAAVLYFLMRRN